MANLSVQEDGGGDYTTLDEALDNIGAAETITIEGEWDSADTRNAIVSTDCTITASGAARVTTARHIAETPTHYRLQCASNGSHCITVNDSATVIDGIEIKQASTGTSDECIRMAHDGGTLTVTNSILYSGRGANDQDGIYTGSIDCTVNVTQCIIYNFLRAGLHCQSLSAGKDQTWNINSCSIYNCSQSSEDEGGGISIERDTAGVTHVINVHNTWCLDCTYSANKSYNEDGDQSDVTWNISYSIDDDNSIASRDAGGAGNQATRVISDASDEGEGSFVIVNDITDAVPFDLSLQDLGNAENNAQDEHAQKNAEGMDIPGTDIDGTSRPANTNYDVGAFELPAGGALTASVADNIGVADNVTMRLLQLKASVQDAIGVADNITMRLLQLHIDVTDNIGLADNVTAVLDLLKIAVEDGIGVADNTTERLDILKIDVSDNIGVADNVSADRVEPTVRTVDVADNVGVSDNVTARLTILQINVEDGIGVADNVTARLDLLKISVEDDIGVADNVTAERVTPGTLTINVQDNVGVADNVSAVRRKILTLTGASGVTSVTPKFVFPSGTVKVEVEDIYIKDLTSDVADDISLSEGEKLEYICSDYDTITSIDLGNDKVSGDISSWTLPNSLVALNLSNTSVSGDISSWTLPNGLAYLGLYVTSVSGDISGLSLPSSLVNLYLFDTSVSGDISGWTLPNGLENLGLYETSVSGDISGLSLPSSLVNLYLFDTQIDYDSSSGAFTEITDSLGKIDIDNCSLTTQQIDNVLADLVTSAIEDKSLDIGDNNAYPSGVSNYNTLISRGWTIKINMPEINVSDNIGVADNVTTIRNPLEINVSDNIGVADNVTTIRNPLEIDVSDNVGLNDNVTARLSILKIDVSDNVGLNDNVTARLSILKIDVEDNIGVSDSCKIGINIKVFDTVGVSDNVTMRLRLRFVDVSDSVGVADGVTARLTILKVKMTDDVGIADAVSCARLPDWQRPTDDSDAEWSKVTGDSDVTWSKV